MELNYLTVQEALEGLRKKELSAVELTRACLEQIEKYDDKLNAFITVCAEEALEEARKADRNLSRDGRPQGSPLQGIPIAVKDNFLTRGIRTTASSKVLDDYIPQNESTVTQRLREAGAIIIGKTNMDAWAHGSSTETSDYGVTKNPWDTERLPGGSSGGSAAAVISDMCIAAIGSETAGSVRQPASWCGVTGLKPSYGRVSRFGVIAMASSTDSPGPLAKTVTDAALILKVIAGMDDADATTIPQDWNFDFRKLRKKRQLKVGLVEDYFLDEAESGVNESVLEAVGVLEKAGIMVRKLSLLDPKYSIADYTIIQRAEVSSNLARYDGIRYGNRRTFFGNEAKRRIMLGTYALSAGYYDQYYNKAQKVRTKIIEDFNRVFKIVDLLIAPTSPSTALLVGSTEGEAMFGEMQDVLVEASSMAGLPGISIPCGFIKGLPVGMQIIGKMGDETDVLHLAHIYQQLTDWHKQRPKI